MSPRNIALTVSGAVVLLAILMLFIEVRAAPPTPSPNHIDEARQRARRPRPAAPAEDPWTRRDPERAEAAQNAAERAIARAPRLGVDTPRSDDGDPLDVPPPPSPTAAAVPNLEGDPRLEVSTAKDEANRLYDKMDYEGAMQRAMQVLEKEPGDVRMMRVVVSSACQLGDADKAKQYWQQLPPHDQNQMTRRCQRFGITFQ